MRAKHVVQATQVENGDMVEGRFSKGYLQAGEDNINSSVTTLVHQVEQRRNSNAIRDATVTVVNQPPHTTLLIATLADNDLTIVVAAVTSSNITGAVAPPFVSAMMNKLAEDDPITMPVILSSTIKVHCLITEQHRFTRYEATLTPC